MVVTPGSGEGRARGIARRLARLLRRWGSAVTIQAFDDLPSLTEWAGACGPEFDVICCVGGDATQSAAALLARLLDEGEVRLVDVDVAGEHGRDHARVGGEHGPGQRDPDQEEERLRDGDRGLGDTWPARPSTS